MIKIVCGVVAAIVIAVGGLFGFQFYTQHRITSEIDAAFEQIRATGAKASHGKVSFDLLSHTITVADIVGELAAQPPVGVKIAMLTASGVSQPDATRFSADSLQATNVEISVEMPTRAPMHVTYRLPQLTVKDYTGPASAQRLPASSSFIDLYRYGFERLASISATSITAPTMTGTMTVSSVSPGSAASSVAGGDFTYSGLAATGLKDGKIASMTVDKFLFTINTQIAGKADKMTGDLAKVTSYDTDIGAMAAMLDPQKANDDRYYRVYRQVSTGPYIITSGQGPNIRIDGMTVDDVGISPSRTQLPALLAMMPAAGAAPPTPAQAREMLEKLAGFYEGIRIGSAEIHGFSMEMPEGQFKLSRMRFDLDEGKVGEFAIEGLDMRTPKGPFKIERFALKAVDIANLMRMSAAASVQKPSPGQALGMIALIEGAELKGLVAPFKNTGKTVNVDTIKLDWGQFIGPIPTKAHLIVKMSSPLDATDPKQKALVTAGIDTMAIDVDLGTAWTEDSHTFVLEPAALEVSNLLKASAHVSLGDVPREIFSPDPAQAMAMAAQAGIGTLELTWRDLGGVDLAAAQFARSQNITRDAARRAMADVIRSHGEAAAAANPDAAAAVDALARFVESPEQTLIIKLTPLGKVPALQLIQTLQTDPLAALAQFKIEASTGL
jgi:hypothetical protein